MIAYTGAGASASVRARCARAGIRTLLCPRDFPAVPTTGRVARRLPHGAYAVDNGVFELHRRGERLEGAARARWELITYGLVAAVEGGSPAPDWCVLPDVVANGRASLRVSLAALDDWCDAPWPWALVVQDGMTPATLPWDAPWRVLFVGGSLPWKLRTGASWVRAAHEHGRRAHIGRVGTVDRVRWAAAAGADSVDSCLPLWSVDKLDGFASALEADPSDHGPLFASL